MFEQFIGTKPVEERHRFDISSLEHYLAGHIPELRGPLTVEQFKGGQSNPTYRLIDARHREVYEKGHIPGATNVPASLLPVQPDFLRMRATPDQPVILYCTGGDCDESNRVWELLRALQYQNVRIFHGGWAVWEKSGHPIERGPDPLPLDK